MGEKKGQRPLLLNSPFRSYFLRLFPQVCPSCSNDNTSHAASFQPPRNHASVIRSVEINGFYFHGIAMVMNRVVNHRIARVTDHVINQDFSFFLFFFLRVRESERHTLVISQLIHVHANARTLAMRVACSCGAGVQPAGGVTPWPPLV